jgi:hypothetical protein
MGGGRALRGMNWGERAGMGVGRTWGKGGKEREGGGLRDLRAVP